MEKFEKNNVTIALNISYAKKEKIYPAYVSKHNLNMNCLYSFAKKIELESHKKVCENKNVFNIMMASEDTKILEFNQYKKFDKPTFIIYADLKCFIEKTDRCKNNPENSPTTKVVEHIPSGFELSTILSFKSIENNHDVYRGKDSMKNFCESFREHATEIINYKKKKLKLLTNKQKDSYQNSKICHICKEKFEVKIAADNKYCKVRDHCHYTGEYRGAVDSICNLRYSVPKEIPIVFHNRSNYDYHLIIKELAEEFEKYFICLGENTKKILQFQ